MGSKSHRGLCVRGIGFGATGKLWTHNEDGSRTLCLAQPAPTGLHQHRREGVNLICRHGN